MDEVGRYVIRTGDETLLPASWAQFQTVAAEIDPTLRDVLDRAMQDGSAQAADVRLTAFTFGSTVDLAAHGYRPTGTLSASLPSAWWTCWVSGWRDKLAWKDEPPAKRPNVA